MNTLCTKSRVRSSTGLDTYFNSTKFAVYNGQNHDQKKSQHYGAIRLKVMRKYGDHNFHFNSISDHNTIVVV